MFGNEAEAGNFKFQPRKAHLLSAWIVMILVES